METAIILTGMHRSATSLAASLFHLGGVSFGEKLAPSRPGNIKGQFENLEFQKFHRDVLSSVGLSEAGWVLDEDIPTTAEQRGEALNIVSRSAREPAWGWKDPRTTLFLDFWRSIIPGARFVFLYRSVWEVADSLYRRSGLYDQVFVEHPEFAIELWIHYNTRILKFFDAYPNDCILVSASELVKSPLKFIDFIQTRFNLTLDRTATEVCEPDLFNTEDSKTTVAEATKRQYSVVDEIWDQLEQRSSL